MRRWVFPHDGIKTSKTAPLVAQTSASRIRDKSPFVRNGARPLAYGHGAAGPGSPTRGALVGGMLWSELP